MRRVDLQRLLVAASMFAVLLMTTYFIAGETHSPLLLLYWLLGVGVVGACVAAFLVGKRYTHLAPADGAVLCIVPAYNEPAESLARTVDALLAQTVPVDIVVIDDGSDTPVVPTTDDPRVIWRRQPNTGKRGAQVAVLRSFPRDRYDFVLTVDSDSSPIRMRAASCCGRCPTPRSRPRRE